MRTGQFTLITQNMFRHAPTAQHLAFPAHGCLNEIGTFIVQASKLYILDHFDVSYSQKNIHLTRVDAIGLVKACNCRDCMNKGRSAKNTKCASWHCPQLRQ